MRDSAVPKGNERWGTKKIFRDGVFRITVGSVPYVVRASVRRKPSLQGDDQAVRANSTERFARRERSRSAAGTARGVPRKEADECIN